MNNKGIIEFADRMVDEERESMLRTLGLLIIGNIESMDKIGEEIVGPITHYPDYIRGRIDAYKSLHSMISQMRKDRHKDLSKVYEDD